MSLYINKTTSDRMAANEIKFSAKKAHNDSVAKSLGYRNAQEAFNSIGKKFITLCK